MKYALKKRWFSVLLILTMLAAMIPAEVRAADVDTEKTLSEPPVQVVVSEVKDLDEVIRNQEYEAGELMDADGIQLPDVLIGKSESDEELTITGVTWSGSGTAFDPNEEGEYYFTAVLPEGYTFAADTEVPKISVGIRAAASVMQPMSYADGWFEVITTGGDLQNLLDTDLTGQGIPGEYKKVTKLKISGPMADSDYTFIRNVLTKLEELDIEGITSTFPTGAFNRASFKKIRLSDTAELSSGMFSFCSSLDTMVCGNGDFTNGVIDLSRYSAGSYGNSAFEGSGVKRVRLPSNVEISAAMFAGCGSLDTMVCGTGEFTSGVIDLSGYSAASYGGYVFSDSEVNQVRLPNNVAISGDMFSECSSLDTMVCGAGAFTNGVIDLSGYSAGNYGERAFYQSVVKQVRLPEDVELSRYMFAVCHYLNTLVCGTDDFTNGVIDLSGYSAGSYDEGVFSGSGVKQVRLPSGTMVSKEMFDSCYDLDTLVCGSGELISGVFDLSGYSVGSFGVWAFNSNNMKQLRLPGSVEISARLFSGCSSLDTLYFIGSGTPEIDGDPFGYMSLSGTIYYPEGETGYDAPDDRFADTGVSGWTRIAYAQAEIAGQPVSCTVSEGENAEFSIKTADKGTLTYQWETSKDGVNWEKLSDDDTYGGTKESKLQVKKVKLAYNGYQYRCVVKNILEDTASSNAAKLQVKGAGAKTPVKTSKGSASKAVSAPKTGDNSILAIWLGMTALSLSVVSICIWMFIKRRKESMSK